MKTFNIPHDYANYVDKTPQSISIKLRTSLVTVTSVATVPAVTSPPALALMCLTAWGRGGARAARRQHPGRAARARLAAAEGDRVVRAPQQLRGHMREEGPVERAAGEERRLKAERAAQVVPAEDLGVQQHRHHQLQFVVERRHGAVRAAALVPGRGARAVRVAVAARQAHQLLRRLRRRRVRRHTDHPEHSGHDPTGAARLAAGDGVCYQHIQAFRDVGLNLTHHILPYLERKSN